MAKIASLLTVAAVLLFVPVRGVELGPEVRAKAEKVQAALRTIETGPRRTSQGPRSVSFTEAEFNAWIAFRLDEEKEPYVKSAEFKLLADDKVEGRILLVLGQSPPGGLLSGRQDLVFSAGFEARDGRIRIGLDSLFLGTQKLSPSVIDLIIGVVSRLQGAEPTSIRDWYDLPPGVEKLRTQPGRLVVIY